MKKSTAITALAAIGFMVLAVAAYAMTRINPNPPKATSGSTSVASATAEKQFIEQMVVHHADAIGMAQLAPDKAKSPEVKALAASIAAAQQKDIDQMKGWYKSWYGKDLSEMSDMAGMSEESGNMMNALRTSTNFDLAFVTQMIPHHQKAVAMAQAILPQATHQELKDLATAVISSQTAEINQMEMLKTSFQPRISR